VQGEKDFSMRKSKVLAPSPAAGNAGPDFQPTPQPNPEVLAKAKRRRFTVEYKQQYLGGDRPGQEIP
jgi:hypothetical protein